jgi:hypothetical protein
LGIDAAFGLPGGSSNGIMAGLRAGLPMKVIIYNDSLGQIPREQLLLRYPGPGVRSPRSAAGFAAWAGPRGGYRAQVCDPGKSAR